MTKFLRCLYLFVTLPLLCVGNCLGLLILPICAGYLNASDWCNKLFDESEEKDEG